jgi:hypothetical protein
VNLTDATWTDQVTRRIRFSEAHPQVHIEHKTYPGPHCEARWIRDDGTPGFISDVWLEGLLDSLEALEW